MSSVDTLKEHGNRFFKNRNYTKAIKYYKEGLKINPINLHLNCNIAQAYLATGDYIEAEVHAVVTLALQENSVKGYYRAAKAAFGLSKPMRALLYVNKGLCVCPNSEDLQSLLKQMKNSEPTSRSSSKTRDKKSNTGATDKEEPTTSISDSEVQSQDSNSVSSTNSRSTSVNSRMGPDENEGAASIQHSTTDSHGAGKKKKKNRGPIEIEDIQNDKFLKTLESLRSTESKKTVPSFFISEDTVPFTEIQKKLQIYLKEGSEALEKGLARNASEKYKSAVEIVIAYNIEVLGWKDIDFIILKYSLCISWTESANYNNIAESVDCLIDIEDQHSVKFPAVYFALGNAYHKLNRFKIALVHLEKGMKIIERGIKMTAHPWPGTMNIIKETTKSGLEESLEKLIQSCKTYREPDAVCRHEKCLHLSSHIIPSEIIFYSDPDYIGYVVVICQENCKITFHIGCWKDFKEAISPVAKLSDKDVLGRRCITSDCVTENNISSVIVRIKVYGNDGNIKSQCYKEPIKIDSNNKEPKKEKKKKNDKPVEVPTPQGKVKSKCKKEHKLTTASETQDKETPEEGASDVKRTDYLGTLRTKNFGHKSENCVQYRKKTLKLYSDKEFFGQKNAPSKKTTSNPGSSQETEELKNKKEFVFTFFYEFINNEGPQKIINIEEKWKDEVSKYPGMDEFMLDNGAICDFLLKSHRFAAVSDCICVVDQVPNSYKNVSSVLGDGLSFILTEQTNPLTVPGTSDGNINIHNNDGNGTKYMYGMSAPRVNNSSSYSENDSEDDSEEEEEEEEVEGGDESSDEDNQPDDCALNSKAGEFHIEIGKDLQNVEMVIESAHNNKPIETESETKIQHTSLLVEGTCDKATASDVVLTIDRGCNCSPIFMSSAPVVTDSTTQTEPGRNYELEIQQLDSVILTLKKEVQKFKESNGILLEKLESESRKIESVSKDHEVKISVIKIQKEQEIQNLHSEILKKDSKMDTMKKKYIEQIDKLSKKLEEQHEVQEEQLTNFMGVTKSLEKLQLKAKEEQDEIKKYRQQALESKKDLEEYKVNIYAKKCAERLFNMNSMLKYLSPTSTPSVLEMNDAITQWEKVQEEVTEIGKKLQQLDTTCIEDYLEFTPVDLPKEPPYPIEDMESILRKALGYLPLMSTSGKSGEGDAAAAAAAAAAAPPASVDSQLNNPLTRPSPPSLMSPLPVYQPVFLPAQGQNLFMNPTAYRPYTGYPNNAFHMPGYPVRMATPASALPPSLAPMSGYSIPTSVYPANISNGPIQHPLPNEVEATDGNSFGMKSTKKSPEVEADKENICVRKPNIIVVPNTNEEVKEVEKKENLTEKKEPWFGMKKKTSSAAGLIPIETKKGSSGNEAKKPTAVSRPIKFLPAQSIDVKSTSFGTEKQWNYQKLITAMQKNFRRKTDLLASRTELVECLSTARERNNGSLSGLSVPVIYQMVEKILKERSDKKLGTMGMDKFGGAAWGGVKEKGFTWNKPDDELEECIICHIQMTSDVTSLRCKHAFHTKCIRKWLNTNSTCPVCREYTTLNDEFPPLG